MYLCACIWVLRVNILLSTSTISLYYKFDSLWLLGEQRTKSKSSTVWLFQPLLWPANYFCKKKMKKKQFSSGPPFQDNIQKRGKKRLGTELLSIILLQITPLIVHMLLKRLSHNKYQKKNLRNIYEPDTKMWVQLHVRSRYSQISPGSLPLQGSLSSEGRPYAQIPNSGLKKMLP